MNRGRWAVIAFGVAATGSAMLLLLAWSFARGGPGALLAFLGALALMVGTANLLLPSFGGGAWTRERVLGAGAITLGCLVLALGHVGRVEGVALPRLLVEQTAPFAWLAAAALFLAGAWQRLGRLYWVAPTPRCGTCASPVYRPRCLRCGALFDLSPVKPPLGRL
jgi:hypothetical protein